MRRALRTRLARPASAAGFTLVELLVASTLTIILVGGVVSLMISALRDQPGLSQKAVNIQTARWVLERMTHELRNGITVDQDSPSSVSFQAYVRHAECGGTTQPPSTSPSIRCEVTYTCSGTSCTRLEAAPGVFTGTATTIFTGLSNSEQVFTYSPSSGNPTYVGVTLTLPDPSGSGNLTISDGANLRNATLGND